jgi:methyl-accepting chemotaxis protein
MKRFLFRLDTINKRLLLPPLLLVMLLIGALGSVLVAQQQHLLNSMMDSKGNSLVDTLATISEPYLINFDTATLENFVKDTVKDTDVAFAEYYDSDGSSLTGNVMKAPADTSHLLVYQHTINDIRGKPIGKIRVGFKTGTLDQAAHDSIAMVVASLVVVLGLLALGLALNTRSVTTPLKHAMKIARGVADGDLMQQIEVMSRDETGQLMQALKDMNASLGGIVSGVRVTTGSINTASQEIAAGNSNLSQRTEQQASSLEETASSMEELTSHVKKNAEHARHASEVAEKASEIATRGGLAVKKSVRTMDLINTSSNKIGDIIGVIENITFQTNILALNAAVEAAHAGDQGRGFAVVAAEVRDLAQRSAAAAKEIKALVSESVENVSAGAKEIKEAEDEISDVVASVELVSTLLKEIRHATEEQSTGIAEVNQAIIQMDEMTQQNAALVEESAAAAEAMLQQAADLMQAVSVFKLATDQGDVRNAAGAEPAKKRVAESEAAQPGKKRRQAGSADLTSLPGANDLTAANLAFDSNAA